MDDTLNRIIEMAWEDRTPFEAIKQQTGYSESEVTRLMRLHLKPQSFKLWRKRVQGRSTKHANKRAFKVGRFHCTRQKPISHNRISKRK